LLTKANPLLPGLWPLINGNVLLNLLQSRFSLLTFAGMIDFIRRFKMTYVVYNFFHRKELLHNSLLYKKYGLKKKYFSSISSKDFRNAPVTGSLPAANAALSNTALYQASSTQNQESILSYAANGFLVLRNYLTTLQADALNAEVERLVKSGTVKPGHRNKIMFAIHHSALLRSIDEEKKLKDFLAVLMEGEPVLFQSINFVMGSEQHTHSDSIHMTTYPQGGLLGVWIALDDINENNGPLHYYPGSHLLPYYLNSDYDNEGSACLLGNKSYDAYEAMIAAKIEEKGIQKKIFTARKGDLLVWHANLFHGGEPHSDKNLTRKSMVLHYFKKDAICYHEITQRPALIKMQ